MFFGFKKPPTLQPLFSLLRNSNRFCSGKKVSKKSAKEKSFPKVTVQTTEFEPQIDDGTYRNPEYYQHQRFDYHELHKSISKHRCALPVPGKFNELTNW